MPVISALGILGETSRPSCCPCVVRRFTHQDTGCDSDVTAAGDILDTVADAEFRYSDLLPTGKDDTPYRLITTEGVSAVEVDGRTFLKVDPEAIRLLTAEAMKDVNQYLRPAHLRQLRKIIDDPEASGNDRFAALDLLKNVNISARRHPADVPGHRHRDRHGEEVGGRAHRRR
jgi:hypothetical protein